MSMRPAPFDAAQLTYCLRCGYALAGLAELRCPECGRPFDPADPRTFRRSPRRLGRFIKPVLVVLVGVVFALVVAAGIYYWQYRLHARLLDQVAAQGWAFKTGRVSPAWLDARMASWDLPVIRMVSSIDLGQAEITDHDLVLIGDLTHLRSVSFNGAGVTDAGSRHLMDLQRLETLEIFGSQITDEGLVGIDRLGRLKALELFSSRISDQSLPAIGRLAALTELGLAHTRVTDAGMHHLAGLNQLTGLDLSHNSVGDEGLVHLGGLTRLRSLNLSFTNVTDRGLEKLRILPNLHELDITGTFVTPKGKRALQRGSILPGGLHVEGPR